MSPVDQPAFGEEDISLRGCVNGTRGLVALGLVGSIAAALLAVVTGDERWAMAVVMAPIGVLVLGPMLWLRWLSPRDISGGATSPPSAWAACGASPA